MTIYSHYVIHFICIYAKWPIQVLDDWLNYNSIKFPFLISQEIIFTKKKLQNLKKKIKKKLKKKKW